ncbi:lysM and putative peptidoglycan-binding domain-containing protein 2 [Hydra vulgaris]|uniref:lysM and putative peptidoglycan-binding domain-containing protein 2 n=1 Tax=Hydra vulgaris TaxID=6087 RepID=UPI001F5ECEA2|nr:lysM and putative peptidoglycan-binding domain-containing protein 2 [Hydra vulgaris]
MSLSNSIQSQRRYGSTSLRGAMLSVTNSDLFVHKVESSDTLQGLAIKYGVTIEELKRVNKLWTNEFLHFKETLVIPCSSSFTCNYSREPLNEPLLKNSSNINEKNYNNHESEINCNQENFSSQSSDFTSFVGILSKIDVQINLHKKKYHTLAGKGLPNVTFDSYQHYEATMSPTRSMSPLEQDV